MERIFVKTRDAARFLGLSPKTLEKWRVVGGGPKFRKLGGAVLYDQHELTAWADSRVRLSTSDPGQSPE